MKYENIVKMHEEKGHKAAIDYYADLVWNKCIEALEKVPNDELTELFNKDDVIIRPNIDFYFDENQKVKIYFINLEGDQEFVFTVDCPYDENTMLNLETRIHMEDNQIEFFF